MDDAVVVSDVLMAFVREIENREEELTAWVTVELVRSPDRNEIVPLELRASTR